MEGIVAFPVVERDRESLFAQEAKRNMIQKKKWKRRMKWANYFICYSDSLLKPHNFLLHHYEQNKIVKAQNIHHERRNAKDKQNQFSFARFWRMTVEMLLFIK